MSTGLSHVARFDKVALAEEDKAVILKVAKKSQECALFISEYTNTPGFGTLFLRRIRVRVLNLVFYQLVAPSIAYSSIPMLKSLDSRKILTPWAGS